jgi:hypothetical protein
VSEIVNLLVRQLRQQLDARARARIGVDAAVFGKLLGAIAKVAKPMDRNECKDLHNLDKFVLWIREK